VGIVGRSLCEVSEDAHAYHIKVKDLNDTPL